MGACAGKEQKQQNYIKSLSQISHELLKARKTMFRLLNASDKMENKLEKINAQADIELISKQMVHYEGQYDYQSFINSFDILTQLIQRSKDILEVTLKNCPIIKNPKLKNLIDSLNQYLSIFVLETCEDCEIEEGVNIDSPENNNGQLYYEDQNGNQNNESLKKIPNDLGRQQSVGDNGLTEGNTPSNILLQNTRFNSKSEGNPTMTTNIKGEQTFQSLRKRGSSTKQFLGGDSTQINFLDYKKNCSIINRQRNPSRQKSYSVFIVDGQIKIQQQISRIDLITSDSQIG